MRIVVAIAVSAVVSSASAQFVGGAGGEDPDRCLSPEQRQEIFLRIMKVAVAPEIAARAMGGNPVKRATEDRVVATKSLETCLKAEPASKSGPEACASERELLRGAETQLETARAAAVERRRETQVALKAQVAAIRADYPKCSGDDR